jgi:hypothetical protein
MHGVVSVDSSFWIGACVHNAWLTGTTEGSRALTSVFLMQKVETTDTAPIGLFAQRAASGDFSLRG